VLRRYDIENKESKSEDDKRQVAKLYKSFGAYHGASSSLNLVVFVCCLSHAWTLSSGLSV
jgi:hypothetical protein